MLRRCLYGLVPHISHASGLMFLLLTLAFFSTACSPHQPTPNISRPERRVIIVGGDANPNDANCTFYLDVARVYETLVRDLHILTKQITVLYSNGAFTHLAESHDDCVECNDELEEMHLGMSEKNWQTCESAIAQLSIQPPITGDTHKETILKTVHQALVYAPENSQLWIFRSGHGEMLVDSAGIHSMMQVMDNATISDAEWNHVLQTPTRASQIILFLNQCHAFGFLDLPVNNPRLVVFTACGAKGPDYAYLIYNAGNEWTWSSAWRKGLAHTDARTTSPFAADANQDGRVNLIELHQFILEHDVAAHDGIIPRHDSSEQERIHSSPGLAWGNEIDPTQVILVEE